MIGPYVLLQLSFPNRLKSNPPPPGPTLRREPLPSWHHTVAPAGVNGFGRHLLATRYNAVIAWLRFKPTEVSLGTKCSPKR